MQAGALLRQGLHASCAYSEKDPFIRDRRSCIYSFPAPWNDLSDAEQSKHAFKW